MNKVKGIYAIKDKRSDKVIYVGQTKDFQDRKRRHFRIKEKERPIDNYMFYQGKDNFEMYTIEELNKDMSLEEIRNKEQFYIEKYNTIIEGFNKQRSGTAYTCMNEHRKQYLINYYLREEYKKKHREQCKNSRIKLNTETL